MYSRTHAHVRMCNITLFIDKPGPRCRCSPPLSSICSVAHRSIEGKRILKASARDACAPINGYRRFIRNMTNYHWLLRRRFSDRSLIYVTWSRHLTAADTAISMHTYYNIMRIRFIRFTCSTKVRATTAYLSFAYYQAPCNPRDDRTAISQRYVAGIKPPSARRYPCMCASSAATVVVVARIRGRKLCTDVILDVVRAREYLYRSASMM
jgi:hypothetical protein